MIFGTGIDIIETARIKKAAGDKFIKKIFTEKEIAYCEQKKDRHISYAGHFAAKEAFVKALQTGISDGVSFLDIEVNHKDSGAPTLSITGKAKKLIEANNIKNICVSISHLKEIATAIVILEQ